MGPNLPPPPLASMGKYITYYTKSRNSAKEEGEGAIVAVSVDGRRVRGGPRTQIRRQQNKCIGPLFIYSLYMYSYSFHLSLLMRPLPTLPPTKYLHIEYRAMPGVFRSIDPPPPLHPASVSSPRTKRGGGTHSPGGEGVGGQYFGRRPTLDWPLTV